jgi:putative glutamine amidotransferase
MIKMRPLIGIAGNELLESVPVFGGMAVAYSPNGFIKGVHAAKGNPLVIPIGSPETAKEYVSRMDGILLTGGQDVSPHYYGEEPGLHMQATFPLRDEFEMALIAEALLQKKPIFAVCRGIQILNVQMGGTLYQDLDHDYPDVKIQHVQKTTFKFPTHSVITEPGSHLHELVGGKIQVNSYHHQAVKEIAKGLKPVGYSPDGIVEALEATDPEQSILAIQWHPETMIPDSELMQLFFNDFIERSAKK